MRTLHFGPLTIAAVLALSLAGCTFSVNATVSPDQIANLAEDALEAEIGVRPEIDCGNESISLVEGTVVPCLLIDPASGAEFDVDVTLTHVDGTNVTVYAQVANTPNHVPENNEPTTGESNPALTLSAAEIAATAEMALIDAALLPNPAVVCPGSSHEVSVGYVLDCTVMNGGDQYAATVTITSVEGSSYSLTVNVPDLAN